jgi:crotonobetainyl-CoA:carnitine CoA-transferase CaiB-like acyl-CoA transferase
MSAIERCRTAALGGHVARCENGSAVSGSYAAPDLWAGQGQGSDLLIAPVTSRNFSALCKVTGQRELVDDARFNTVPALGANWTLMMQVMEKWTGRYTVKECIAALDRAGVPAPNIATPARR